MKKTFCVLCQEPLLVLENVFGDKKDRDALFCNNGSCPRFGLLTVVSSPVGGKTSLNEPEELEEEADQED